MGIKAKNTVPLSQPAQPPPKALQAHPAPLRISLLHNCISPHHLKAVSCNTRDFPQYKHSDPGLSTKQWWCGHHAPRWMTAPTSTSFLQPSKQQWHHPQKVIKCMEKFVVTVLHAMASNRERGEGRGVPKTGSKPPVLKPPPGSWAVPRHSVLASLLGTVQHCWGFECEAKLK